MSEIAVISARKSRLRNQANLGSKSAASALQLAEEPNNFLSTVQVGITLIGILTGLYSGDVLAYKLSPVLENWGMAPVLAYRISQTFIVIIVTYFSIIFGELLPKRIGLGRAEKIAKIIARPMQGLSFIARPFVWILSTSTTLLFNLFGIQVEEEKVTEEEIKFLIQESREDGEVQQVEQEIVERVFTLGDRDLESIMTPRREIVWLNSQLTKEEIRVFIAENPHTKYPVGDGSLDKVEGIAYLTDLFLNLDCDDFDLKSIVREAQLFYESKEVYSALEEMKTKKNHYALIVDEFGAVSGLVTMKDMLEAFVGDIPESHEQPEIIQRADGSYLVDGQCSFYNFLSYFKLGDLYSDHEYNTLGGLILEELGNIPQPGDTINWQGFLIEVVDMDGTRIDKVLVTRTDNL